MAYLAIAILLLVIIAPIIAILPSARQKEQMRLRKRAMAEGFNIEFVHIDDPDPDPEKYLSNTGKPLPRVMEVKAYRFKRPRPLDWRRVPTVNWALVRRQGMVTGLPPNWSWDGDPTDMSGELMEFLYRNIPQLPDDVVRFEEVKYIISIYWNERGGDEALDAIMRIVKGCAQVLPFNPAVDDDLQDT